MNNYAGTILAAGIHTNGLVQWINQNVVGLVLLVIGISLILLAKKKNLSDLMTIVVGVIIGLVVIGVSVNGNGAAIGSWIAHLVTG